jgi:hypothetical protein
MKLKSIKEVFHRLSPFMHGELPTAEMAAAVAKARDYLHQNKPNLPRP